MWGLKNMAKRPDTQESLVFALELLRRIPRHRRITARELHKQLQEAGLNKGLRTVQRQLKMLSEYVLISSVTTGTNLTVTAGLNRSPKDFVCRRLGLQDSLLLTLAEQYLRKILPAKLMKSMEGFFTHARYELAYHDGQRSGTGMAVQSTHRRHHTTLATAESKT